MKLIYHDGGRAQAGYVGDAGDCVTRAIAIATQLPYQQVYDALHEHIDQWRQNSWSKAARRLRSSSPRDGVHKPIYKQYLAALGWKWTPTMLIGSGCKVHLREGELPMGRLVVCVSKHMVAVIDGVIHDTHDPSRGGTRCVYGYFSR